MSDALGANPDRRSALAHFVLQMSPHDAELLQQALDQARPPAQPGGATGGASGTTGGAK